MSLKIASITIGCLISPLVGMVRLGYASKCTLQHTWIWWLERGYYASFPLQIDKTDPKNFAYETRGDVWMGWCLQLLRAITEIALPILSAICWYSLDLYRPADNAMTATFGHWPFLEILAGPRFCELLKCEYHLREHFTHLSQPFPGYSPSPVTT